MEEKKYKLLEEEFKDGYHLHRIQALKDFNNVKKGDIGGYVESEDNLSQYGNCWIYNDAVVCEYAEVYDDAQIHDKAWVFRKAKVFEDAIISGIAQIFDRALIYGQSKIYDNAEISNEAQVYEHAEVFEDAQIYRGAIVLGYAKVYGDVEVEGAAYILGKSKVYGNLYIGDHATIDSDAVLSKSGDYFTFLNICIDGEHLTWTRSNNMWRFDGKCITSEELIETAHDISMEMVNYFQSCIYFVKNCK